MSGNTRILWADQQKIAGRFVQLEDHSSVIINSTDVIKSIVNKTNNYQEVQNKVIQLTSVDP